MYPKRSPFIVLIMLVFGFSLSASAPARSQGHSSSKGTIAKLKLQIAAQAETIRLLEESKALHEESISLHKETISLQQQQLDRMRIYADCIQNIEEREADLFDQCRKDGLLKGAKPSALRQQNEGLIYTLRELIDLFLLRNSLSSGMKNQDHLGTFTFGELQLGGAPVTARPSIPNTDAPDEIVNMSTKGLKPRVESRLNRSKEDVPMQSETPESKADGARVRIVIPDNYTDVIYQSEVKDITSKKKKTHKSVHPKKP